MALTFFCKGRAETRSQEMTRKTVFALATVLALGSLSFATDAAFARGGHGGGGHGGGGHGGGHFGGGHFGGGHFGGHGGHFAAPRIGGHGPRFAGHGSGFGGPHGHFVRGHGRHFWHGRWWDYGVGPCWVWSDVYAEYVWVCF
jgi:hypothetical protein